MADKGKDNMMRRKAGAGRPAPEIGRVTATRALQAAIAQGAEEYLTLVATATNVTETRANVRAFLEKTPQDALFCLCQAREIHFGIVVFDKNSLSALIEQQTTGRVVPNPAVARTPTRTDAQLCAGFLDNILGIFEQNVAAADLPVATAVRGYRYALPLADARAVEMTLPDIPYRLFDLQIDFGEGAKTGQMQILLPFEADGPKAEGENDLWHEDLTEAVHCTRVEMDAILDRKEMALADIAAFQVGSLLKFPLEVIQRVQLEDLNGASITLGHLGQTGGKRAIRIAQQCDATTEEATDFDVPKHGVSEGAGGLSGAGATPMGDAGVDGALPDVPAMSDLGAAPQPGLPDIPDLPDLAAPGSNTGAEPSFDAGDLAGLGTSPDNGNIGDLPDISDLSELPDLENV